MSMIILVPMKLMVIAVLVKRMMLTAVGGEGDCGFNSNDAFKW